MKVLFLDIDGVLNSQPFLIEAQRIRKDWEHSSSTERSISMINPDAVELLNEIVQRTDCAVVVSSSWRIGNNRHELQHYLELRGFRFSVLGCTPIISTPDSKRGHEIQRWLDEWEAKNPGDIIESFTILDDDSDMAHLMDRLVQTKFTVGLTNAHVEHAVSLLGEASGDPV